MTALPIIEVRNSELLPSSPLGQRLCEIFSYRWHSISSPNTVKPAWITHTKHPLRPRILWRRWNDPDTLIGVRFGNSTTYALIDIDQNSQYHPTQNPAGVSLILAALETIGIVRHILIRSSSSGGLHLYLPLPHAVSTYGLAQALKQCLEAQEIEIAAGQVETFPNTKAYALPGTFTEYNAHRLPLQPNSGSCLLDVDANPISGNLEQFFRHWDISAAGQDLETLNEAISVARRNSSKRKRKRLGVVEEWRDDLKAEIKEGWTGYGQTNHLLKTIACYGIVFERLKGSALAEYIQAAAIKAPGYTAYCRHQHEIAQRCILWARSAEKYWWPLGSTPQRTTHRSNNETENDKIMSINHNQVRAEDAKRRIREAVEHLQNSGKFPADATSRVRLLVKEAHTSVQTLYRYRELWHPGHQNPESATESVTAQIPSSSSDTTVKSSDLTKTPEPKQNKELHALEPNMKCKGDPACIFPTEAPIPKPSSPVVLEFRSSSFKDDQ